MKLVLAVVPPSRMEAVRQALAEVHVTRLSVVDGHGYQTRTSSAAKGASQRIVRHLVLEIAVNDDFLDRTVEVIEQALRLRAPADTDLASESSQDYVIDPGGIYVLPMDTAVQIYRDVRGPEAL